MREQQAGLKLLLLALVGLLLMTALGVVYGKHQSRQLFVHLQGLYQERDTLGIEWGRLQLEQSTLAAPTRVETLASRLGMRVPAADEIIIIR